MNYDPQRGKDFKNRISRKPFIIFVFDWFFRLFLDFFSLLPTHLIFLSHIIYCCHKTLSLLGFNSCVFSSFFLLSLSFFFYFYVLMLQTYYYFFYTYSFVCFSYYSLPLTVNL